MADYPFIVGNLYSRKDVYELLSVPSDRQRGNWETGYNRWGDDLYIFSNVGAAGRSGHDYDNRWIDGRFQWWAKENTHVGQSQIKWMLEPTGNILLFTRDDNRLPFTFHGFAVAAEHADTTPVKIIWNIHPTSPNSAASKTDRVAVAREKLQTLYRSLRETGFSFVPPGEHNIRDVYGIVRSHYPNLCDDGYLCLEHCESGYNSPEWQHNVRTALWDTRRRSNSIRATDRRGYWIFGDGNSAPNVETVLPVDIESVESERVAVTTFRILRDTALARKIKTLHANRCQICGLAIELLDGSSYSEAHHIQPLGKPHDGPDVAGNIIILCPNHHAMCDYGAMRLSRSEIRHHPAHQIHDQFIYYHNAVVVAQSGSPFVPLGIT